MEILPGMIFPLWSIISSFLIITSLLIIYIIKINQNIKFKRICEKAAINKTLLENFKKKYSKKILYKKTKIIEKVAQKYGNTILIELGLCNLWEEKLKGIQFYVYLKKIFKFFPARGLFLCLKHTEEKNKYKKIFFKFYQILGDENVLKKIAIAGNGENFNGKLALSILDPHIEELFEVTTNHKWPVRFFAIKILIFSEDTRAKINVMNAFKDPSYRIRKIVCKEFKDGDKDEIVNNLKYILLNDTVDSVRQIARDRIENDFPEYYDFETTSLTKVQSIHLLNHLKKDSKKDQKMAFDFLEAQDLEIRCKAALFLEKQACLTKLFTGAMARDTAGIENLENLFKKACEVNVSNFLKGLSHSNNPESFLIAGNILQTYGNPQYITLLSKRVFSPSFKDEYVEYYTTIFTKTILCIFLRGNDEAQNLLNNELKNNYKNIEIESIILENLPNRGEIFVPTLLKILESDDSPNKALIRKSIENFPPYLYIQRLNDILSSKNLNIKISVKKEALKILIELNLPYFLQTILENIKLLNYQEKIEFFQILNKSNQDDIKERFNILLREYDSETKSAILSLLPQTNLKDFIPDILNFIHDEDPDVRIAAIKALGTLGEISDIINLTEMLRDPLERVRSETARVIAENGNQKALEKVAKVISDTNEVQIVKESTIIGLGSSKNLKTITILADNLEDSKLQKSIMMALSLKTKRTELKKIIDIFMESNKQKKEQLIKVFINMGEPIEHQLLQLFDKDSAVINQSLADILLKTGFIHKTIKKLKSRKTEERIKAAEILTLFEIKAAYKGIVLAARDSSSKVRDAVADSLKKLKTPEQAELLEDLLNDPDKRIRKYTLWAIERME